MSVMLPPTQMPPNASVTNDGASDANGPQIARPYTNVAALVTGQPGTSTPAPDAYGTSALGGTGARGSALASPPALVGTPRPANYQENLQGASSKLVAFPVGSKSTSDAAALAVVQNGGSIRAEAQQPSETAEAKMKAVQDQADSLTKSAEVSHKAGCQQKFDNHDALVGKLKSVGMTTEQAKVTVRLLEDGAVSPMAKAKISFELASLGVTAAGQANTKAKADNAGEVLTGLQNLANKEGGKLEKVDKAAEAGAALSAVPFAAVGQAVATKKARESVMHNVDGDLSTLAGARTKDDASLIDSQAVQTVQDQTLRPVLLQTQQAL